MTETQIAEIRAEIEQSKATRQRIDRRIAEMREHWI
jgi:septal ring factor EnvC (AmiA/AmiB activator)